MPLYEYKCSECGAVFEALQKFSDPPLQVHDGCGGKVERLLSAPAFQFKGSGFYITDYTKGSNGKNGRKKKDESAPSSVKTESVRKPSAPEPPAAKS